MSALAQIRIVGKSQRSLIQRAATEMPDGVIVTFRNPTRSLEQNAKMWTMLKDVSDAKPNGRLHSTDVWKALFMHSLGHQVQFEQGLDDNGPIPLGFKTSNLTVRQMSDLIEVIYEYGSRNNVTWREAIASGHLIETERKAA